MYSGPNTSLSTRRNSTSQDRSRAVELRNVGGGFPHSEIVGSKLVRSSPTLIAAYHVLHRLSAPRHPPNALKALDRSHDRRPFRRLFRTLIPDAGRKSLDQLASWFAHATARSGAVSCQTSRLLRATGPEGGTNQSFTMSDNTRTTRSSGHMASTSSHRPRISCGFISNKSTIAIRRLVEPDGIEPTTSCLQSTRSPS